MGIKSAIGKVLIWIDTKVNDWVLFGKNETISARMGRNLESENPNPLATIICGFLDIAERHHCKKAYAALRAKEQAKLAALAKEVAKYLSEVDKAEERLESEDDLRL